MKPLSVLIVDDELPLRQELRTFPWESYDAVWAGEAADGLEALRFCGEHRPDIVVTDITMPRMGGLELLREIKHTYPSTQVILLTCHRDFEYAREAVQFMALEYLVKVTFEENEMARALEKARALLEREQMIGDMEGRTGREDNCRAEIRMAKKWIKEHMPEQITLSVVAEQVGLSAHYFSQLFREETGESFHEYLTRTRMQKATHLLKTSNLKVYEVANLTGYPSYRYFSVMFRKWTGESPINYKKSK